VGWFASLAILMLGEVQGIRGLIPVQRMMREPIHARTPTAIA
jgi:hypothetical protein